MVYIRLEHFFITEDGHIGLGPKSTRPGDEICTLLGCQIPMILRKLSHSSSYEIVGETYVRGIMSGEPIFRPLPSKFTQISHHHHNAWKPAFWDSEMKRIRYEDPRALARLPFWHLRRYRVYNTRIVFTMNYLKKASVEGLTYFEIL